MCICGRWPIIERSYEEKVRFRARRQEQFRALRAVEPVTKDGQRIALMMNAGLLVDLPQLSESGAEGIGLFRTELQFMIASTMPKAEEQEHFYRNVIKQAAGRAVTFRTLDIGGDKVVPYFRGHEEENPALGWRAIRLSLDRPGLLRTQLRALLKAVGRHRAEADGADGDRGFRAEDGARAVAEGSAASVALRPSGCRASCNSARCWRCRHCSGSSTS